MRGFTRENLNFFIFFQHGLELKERLPLQITDSLLGDREFLGDFLLRQALPIAVIDDLTVVVFQFLNCHAEQFNFLSKQNLLLQVINGGKLFPFLLNQTLQGILTLWENCDRMRCRVLCDPFHLNPSFHIPHLAVAGPKYAHNDDVRRWE